MSARAVAVVRPAPSSCPHPRFLAILSGPGQLHAYRFKDAATLVEDFWAEVDKLLKEKGVI